MGLIDLQTNLKSLTYGGNGPYVTKNINNPPSDNRFVHEATSRIDDVSRIAQMLVDKPGIKYLFHNTILRAATLQSKIDDQKNKVKPKSVSILQEAKRAGIDTIATVASTLAQVAIDGTGVHFVKGFGRGIKPYIPSTDLNGLSLAGTNLVIDLDKQPSELVDIDPNGKISIARKSDYGQYRIDTNQYYTPSDPIKNLAHTYLDRKKLVTTKNGNITKESRVRLGDQGARNDSFKRANIYWSGSLGADGTLSYDEVDKINALPVQTGKVEAGKSTKYEDKVLLGGQTIGRDFVKFRFHIITPEEEKLLYFRAFIESFTDNYAGAWNDVKYLGRGETFYVYSGFSRKISVSFKIAAATRTELLPLYQKMVYLASSTAPTYGSAGQFMRGTVAKMTIGDYVYELPGIINSVTYAWSTEYPWEIAIDEPEGGGDKLMQELPTVLDCNIEFTPIHNFTPTAGYNKYITTGISEAQSAAFFSNDIQATKTVANPADDVVAPNLNKPPEVSTGPQTQQQSNNPFTYPSAQ